MQFPVTREHNREKAFFTVVAVSLSFLPSSLPLALLSARRSLVRFHLFQSACVRVCVCVCFCVPVCLSTAHIHGRNIRYNFLRLRLCLALVLTLMLMLLAAAAAAAAATEMLCGCSMAALSMREYVCMRERSSSSRCMGMSYSRIE